MQSGSENRATSPGGGTGASSRNCCCRPRRSAVGGRLSLARSSCGRSGRKTGVVEDGGRKARLLLLKGLCRASWVKGPPAGGCLQAASCCLATGWVPTFP